MSEDQHDDDDLSSDFSNFFEEELGDGQDPHSEPAAVTAEAPAETPTPDPDPAPRTDGRDALGRFAPKGETAADSPDAPAANAAESAQPMTPGSPPPAADAATAEAPPPQDEPLPMEPFVVRVGDRNVPIEGAVLTPHGLVVPPERVQDLHTLIGRGVKYDEERAIIKRERAELHQQRQTHQAEVAPVLKEIDQFFGMARALKDAQTPEAQEAAAAQLLEYALQFATNEPLLKERMQFERERAEFELARQAQAPDPEEAASQLQQQADVSVVETFRAWAQTEMGKHLTPQDWESLRARVHQNPAQYLARAGQQLTPEERAAGVEPGEVYLQLPALERDVLLIANVRREAMQREAEHRKALDAAKKAAEENAKRLAAPKVAPTAPKKTTPKAAPKADEVFDSEAEARRLREEFEAMLG